MHAHQDIQLPSTPPGEAVHSTGQVPCGRCPHLLLLHALPEMGGDDALQGAVGVLSSASSLRPHSLQVPASQVGVGQDHRVCMAVMSDINPTLLAGASKPSRCRAGVPHLHGPVLPRHAHHEPALRAPILQRMHPPVRAQPLLRARVTPTNVHNLPVSQSMKCSWWARYNQASTQDSPHDRAVLLQMGFYCLESFVGPCTRALVWRTQAY